MSDALLEFHDVDAHYGAVKALRGVSFAVPHGKIVAIIGANGAGKSTVLRAASGLIPASGGEIIFDGQKIPVGRPDLLVARGLSHAPEGRGVFPQLTVAENLKLGAYLRRDRAAIAEDQGKALTLFPRLKERFSQLAGTLSGGEQQMLAIARALMAKPKLLLLDEPSLGLAPQIIDLVFEAILQINRDGMTILLVEQNAMLALEVSHRGFVLETGRIVAQGVSAELVRSPDIRKAYLGE